MGFYNVINPTSLQAGQPEDVSQVLANFQAIAAVLNGGVDNSNLSPGAAVARSKLDFGLGLVDTDLAFAAGIQRSKIAGGVGMQEIQDFLLAAPTNTVDFNPVPQTYKHLFGIWTALDTLAGSVSVAVGARMNNDTGGSSYFNQVFDAANLGPPTTVSQNTSYGRIGRCGEASAGPGSGIFWIPNYSVSGRQKPLLALSGDLNTGVTTMTLEGAMAYWNSGANITRLTIIDTGQNFATGSRFTLYGIG